MFQSKSPVVFLWIEPFISWSLTVKPLQEQNAVWLKPQHFRPIIQDCIVRRRCFMFSWRAHRVTAISCRRRPATTWTFPNGAKRFRPVSDSKAATFCCVFADWLIVVAAPFVLKEFLDPDTETCNVSTQESVFLNENRRRTPLHLPKTSLSF